MTANRHGDGNRPPVVYVPTSASKFKYYPLAEAMIDYFKITSWPTLTDIAERCRVEITITANVPRRDVDEEHPNYTSLCVETLHLFFFKIHFSSYGGVSNTFYAFCSFRFRRSKHI